MERNDIISALEVVLGAFRARPLLANADDDLYEAYLFSLVIEAARREDAKIKYCDGDEKVVQQLVFRRAPGVLHGAALFTHALLEFPNSEPLEVHVGVRVSGVSQLAHECDVAVLRHDECRRSRANNILPRSRALIVAIEGKYYADSLPLALGRGFLGLGRDFKGVPTSLATNISSEDVVTLVLHHNAQADDGVMPAAHAESRLVGFIINEFHKYKH